MNTLEGIQMPIHQQENQIDNGLKFNIDKYEYDNSGTKAEILELENKIQEIKNVFEINLENLSNSNKIESKVGFLPTRYNAENNAFMAMFNGKEKKLTLGQIMTDDTWGIYYDLDDSVPIDIRKEYLETITSNEIFELRDLQIIKHEAHRIGDMKERGDHQRVGLYQKGFLDVERAYEKRKEETGIIAEKMVKNILKKHIIDNKLDFIVKDVSFDLDMYYDIDFLIERISHTIGVGVEAEDSDTHENLGIQLTTSGYSSVHNYKREALIKSKMRFNKDNDADLEDLILVTLSPKKVIEAIKSWKNVHQNKPGGPDEMLDGTVKNKLIESLLGNHNK